MTKDLCRFNVQVFLLKGRVITFCKYHLNLFLYQRLPLFKEDPLPAYFDLAIEICLPPGHYFETAVIKVSKILLVAGNVFGFYVSI